MSSCAMTCNPLPRSLWDVSPPWISSLVMVGAGSVDFDEAHLKLDDYGDDRVGEMVGSDRIRMLEMQRKHQLAKVESLQRMGFACV